MSARMRMAGLLVLLAATPGGATTTAITGGTVHRISAPAIEGGTVVFTDGALVEVGGAGEVEIPAGAEIVDAKGRHVWPGLIDLQTSLGLIEIGSVRGTVDTDEVGRLNPNARAEVALNASSPHLPVTRANGTLLAATLPRGAVLPGTAALIALDGWTWEELVRRAPLGLVIEWPDMNPNPRRRGGDEEEAADRPAGWETELAKLDAMFDEAEAYRADRARRNTDRDADVAWESMLPVLAGEVPVWIQAQTLAQVRAALDWTERRGLSMVLLDGTDGTSGDAWRVADEIAARGIPVVCKTTRRPARTYEPYDLAYTVPAKLNAAGVKVAFGSRGASNARVLPQEAARAAAYGMPRDAVERGLTLTAAEIAGVADRYGSLDPGKSATLIVVDGDLLETRMHVERAWLDGAEVDLSSHHTELWKKWSSRPLPEAVAK
ncbi:MAG: amidohydrolase family protein [Gemmatimonadetes bacterium]|nr:amidohydrolase family protein [Gemmatimonadota bacterium]